MWQVLRRPSWIAFTVLVLVLAVAFLELGRWQWHRHDERAAFNDRVRASLAASALPVDALLSVESTPPESDDWRQVTAVGRYDADHQLLVRNRVVNGQLGFEVLTPLVTAAGPALLVDRGWVPVGETASDEPAVPAPPAGTVTIAAHVQAPESGGSGADGLPPGQVRRVDIADIGNGLPYPVFGGYAALLPGEPGAGTGDGLPQALLPPEPSGGPHLAYAIQWWLFIGIAMGGWVMLLRAETQPATGSTVRTPRAPRRYFDTGPVEDEEDVDVTSYSWTDPTTGLPVHDGQPPVPTAPDRPVASGQITRGQPAPGQTARDPGVRT